LTDASRRYITENAPAEYVDALVPKFEVSCKRRVFGTGYLETLHKPNLHLISEDLVERIGQRSVFLRFGKELPADAIMLATGFETD
jgi:cation diffusion facilitator CzcD-associated flavoprotein CzcO